MARVILPTIEKLFVFVFLFLGFFSLYESLAQVDSSLYESLAQLDSQMSATQFHTNGETQTDMSLQWMFDESQQAQMQGAPMGRVKQQWQTIANQRFDRDWSLNDRNAILLSLLKLAQHSESKQHRKAFVKAAAEFSGIWKPIEGFFPPLIAEEFLSTKQSLQRQSLAIASCPSGLLIDGVAISCDVADSALVTSGVHRYSWLNLQGERISQVSGEIPLFRSLMLIATPDSDEKAQQQMSQINRHSQLDAAKDQLAPELLSTVTDPADIATDRKLESLNAVRSQDKPTSWLKSPWLWGSLAIVVGGAFILEHNRPDKAKESRTPQTNHGF